jgi:hypothetical protein
MKLENQQNWFYEFLMNIQFDVNLEVWIRFESKLKIEKEFNSNSTESGLSGPAHGQGDLLRPGGRFDLAAQPTLACGTAPRILSTAGPAH